MLLRYLTPVVLAAEFALDDGQSYGPGAVVGVVRMAVVIAP